MTPLEIHNRDAGRIVAEIVKPTFDAGGGSDSVLVLLESVIAGVLAAVVKPGGDDVVLPVVVEGARLRLANVRADMAAKKGAMQ